MERRRRHLPWCWFSRVGKKNVFIQRAEHGIYAKGVDASSPPPPHLHNRSGFSPVCARTVYTRTGVRWPAFSHFFANTSRLDEKRSRPDEKQLRCNATINSRVTFVPSLSTRKAVSNLFFLSIVGKEERIMILKNCIVGGATCATTSEDE